jgi:signal transduction histidine kinase
VRTRARAPESAEAQAERIASLVFMAGRGGQIVFSTLMLASDWRRYDRPVLQATVLAAIVTESAWLSRRLICAGKYDDRLGVWMDCAAAAAAVLVSQQGLGSRDAAPWAKNLAIGAAIGAASTRRTLDNVGTVGLLCAAAIATGVRARGRDVHVAGRALAVNDAISWAGTHLASRSYLNAHRRYARLRDEADELAVERATAAASEAERSRQQAKLHQLTASVLDQLTHSPTIGAAQDAARIEAARLRYALRTGGQILQGLDRALAEIAEASVSRGIRVELVTAELDLIAATGATGALAAAADQALRAASDFGGADRAVLRAVSAEDNITLSVRDHGCGFEPGTGSNYETQFEMISELLNPWAGTMRVSSEPGNGVRVSMTVSAGAREAHDEPNGVGSTTRFEELSAAQARLADRTLLTALLSWRGTGLMTGAAALIGGGARYRSRALAIAQLALAAGESAWYARRALRRDRWPDATASVVDAAAGAAIVLLGHANLDRADRPTWINWPPWTFAANVICGQAMSVAGIAKATAGAAAVIGSNTAQSRNPTDTVADSAGLAAFFLVARFFAAQMRGSAVRLEQARGRALIEGRRLAEVRERSTQLRMLHDHALQTLEVIASRQCDDLALIKSHARAEAARLSRELVSTDVAAHRLGDRLGIVIAEHDGLVVQFDCPDLPALAEPVGLAFCGATGEALTNVDKHARTSCARVTVQYADGRLAVTIADDGIGFDKSLTRARFGLHESIELRMRDAGGAAVIDSIPGAGTRITLTWPA